MGARQGSCAADGCSTGFQRMGARPGSCAADGCSTGCVRSGWVFDWFHGCSTGFMGVARLCSGGVLYKVHECCKAVPQMLCGVCLLIGLRALVIIEFRSCAALHRPMTWIWFFVEVMFLFLCINRITNSMCFLTGRLLFARVRVFSQIRKKQFLHWQTAASVFQTL